MSENQTAAESIRIVHEPDANRYALFVGDEIGSVVDYSINGPAISMHRTFTNPKFRGQGLAGKVVEFAVDDVAANTELRVVPMCWYVDEWFTRNPDRADLLTRGS